MVPIGRDAMGDGEASKGWGAGRGGECQAGAGLLSVQETVREEPLEVDRAGLRRCLTERMRSALAPDQVFSAQNKLSMMPVGDVRDAQSHFPSSFSLSLPPCPILISAPGLRHTSNDSQSNDSQS